LFLGVVSRRHDRQCKTDPASSCHEQGQDHTHSVRPGSQHTAIPVRVFTQSIGKSVDCCAIFSFISDERRASAQLSSSSVLVIGYLAVIRAEHTFTRGQESAKGVTGNTCCHSALLQCE